MTLLDFVRLSRAHLKLIILCVVLGGALGYGYAWLQPTVYASTATGYIGAGRAEDMGEAFSGDALGAQRAQTYLTLVTSRSVADRVVRDLNLNVSSEALSRRVWGEPVTGSPLIRITATASNPTEARDLADAYMTATAAEALALETGGAGGEAVVKLVPLENAIVPTEPISPTVWKYVAAGLALGLALAYLYAFARRSVDNRVRNIRDVEELTGSRSLGVIPRTPEISQQRKKDSKRTTGQGRGPGEIGIASEAMRQLRTNLRYVDVDSETRTIVITSPNAGEGKSTIASNLARVLAASGQPTVLVDADLRRPMQARIFDIDQEVGLTQVLAGEVRLEDALVPSGRRLLKVLPAGRIPPNPSELLGSKRMVAVLKALSADNLVLIDAPPLLPVTDPGLLTAASDGALLVLRVGKTYKEQVRMCAKVLERVNGRLLGTVLNLANPRDLGSVIYGSGFRGYRTDYYYQSQGAVTAEEVPVSLVDNDAVTDGLIPDQEPSPAPIAASATDRVPPAAAGGRLDSAVSGNGSRRSVDHGPDQVRIDDQPQPNAAAAPVWTDSVASATWSDSASSGTWSDPASSGTWSDPAPSGTWSDPAPSGTWSDPAPSGTWSDSASGTWTDSTTGASTSPAASASTDSSSSTWTDSGSATWTGSTQSTWPESREGTWTESAPDPVESPAPWSRPGDSGPAVGADSGQSSGGWWRDEPATHVQAAVSEDPSDDHGWGRYPPQTAAPRRAL